jgi:hypothetical protein
VPGEPTPFACRQRTPIMGLSQAVGRLAGRRDRDAPRAELSFTVWSLVVSTLAA